MGIAAYNRGSRVLRMALDAEQPSHETLTFRDLSERSAKNNGRRLLAATVIRWDNHGSPWLMNRPDRGWAEFGMPYPSLWTIAKTWRVIFVGTGHDAHGRFIAVEPC
jgi:hypothetical protein